MTDEIKILLEKSTTKSEMARILGYDYFNSRISKIVDSFCDDNNINTSMLGSRLHKRKYERIVKMCPICNGEFETKLNHNKEKFTCSTKCSNVFFSKKRIDGAKKTMIRKCSICNKDIICGVTKGKNTISYCDSCRKTVMAEQHKKRKQYTIICGMCKKEFKSCNKNVRFCPGSCSSKYSVKKSIDQGTHKGWKSRKKLVPSYPEKYFMEVLKNLNVKYEYEKPFGKYFIDFEIPDKMIALEIDGKQHDELIRHASDIKKDKFLTENGYTVFRIKWYNPANNLTKEKLYL